MEISSEDKQHIVEQLESSLGKEPIFYLKFSSCEKFAEDICNGDFYGNTASYFREKEIETGERGQGDQYELVLTNEMTNIKFFDYDTKELELELPKGSFRLTYNCDELIPIVSFVGISINEMNIIYDDYTHTDFLFPFSDKEYKTMSERFGEYCVILDAKETRMKIAAYCKSFGFDYVFDKVEYCEKNRIERMQAFCKSSKERFLYKNSDLSYQREYRLAIGCEMPNDHFIRVGKYNAAKIVKSEELKSLALSVGYTSNTTSE